MILLTQLAQAELWSLSGSWDSLEAQWDGNLLLVSTSDASTKPAMQLASLWNSLIGHCRYSLAILWFLQAHHEQFALVLGFTVMLFVLSRPAPSTPHMMTTHPLSTCPPVGNEPYAIQADETGSIGPLLC